MRVPGGGPRCSGAVEKTGAHTLRSRSWAAPAGNGPMLCFARRLPWYPRASCMAATGTSAHSERRTSHVWSPSARLDGKMVTGAPHSGPVYHIKMLMYQAVLVVCCLGTPCGRPPLGGMSGSGANPLNEHHFGGRTAKSAFCVPSGSRMAVLGRTGDSSRSTTRFLRPDYVNFDLRLSESPSGTCLGHVGTPRARGATRSWLPCGPWEQPETADGRSRGAHRARWW